MVTNYTGTGIDDPVSITAGPDGALWFTNQGNNSIGRITTAGVVTNYTGTGIDDPQSITAGPDGALWFTNVANNSIGRITTAGVVTNYTGTGIDDPAAITAGPDGALWFTNLSNNSIGRITTAGVVTNFTGTGIDRPEGITAGPDGALWFTNFYGNSIGQDHHRRGGVQLHRHRHRRPVRDHRRARRRPVVHQRDEQLDRADHHRRRRSPTTPHRASTTQIGITTGPDGALWFTNEGNNSIGRITTAGVVTNYTGTGIDDPQSITAGPDGALWFTNCGQQLDRADHHRRGGDELHRPPASAHPRTIPPDPTGHCGSPTTLDPRGSAHGSIGRITTSGTVSNYKGPGIRHPERITTGPDGALWFTNDTAKHRNTTRLGESPPPGRSPSSPAAPSTVPDRSPPDLTARCGSPTGANHREDHHRRYRLHFLWPRRP